MKHNNKFISFNNQAPTAWNTLIVLIAGFAILLTYTYTYAKENEYVLESQTKPAETAEIKREAPKTVQIITTTEYEAEKTKQAFLADLRECESTNYDHAIGDSGDSVGSYQWQKPTLEDKLGRKLTYNEYYDIATNYEEIHALTYKTYFEDGERWRWYNCTIKIKGTLTWQI